MKTIPEEFSKNGWKYRLVERNEHFAIYNQGGGSAFELVRIRTREAASYEVAGKTVNQEAGEYLPSTNEWGRHGWTYHTLEIAQASMKNKMEIAK